MPQLLVSYNSCLSFSALSRSSCLLSFHGHSSGALGWVPSSLCSSVVLGLLGCAVRTDEQLGKSLDLTTSVQSVLLWPFSISMTLSQAAWPVLRSCKCWSQYSPSDSQVTWQKAWYCISFVHFPGQSETSTPSKGGTPLFLPMLEPLKRLCVSQPLLSLLDRKDKQRHCAYPLGVNKSPLYWESGVVCWLQGSFNKINGLYLRVFISIKIIKLY